MAPIAARCMSKICTWMSSICFLRAATSARRTSLVLFQPVFRVVRARFTPFMSSPEEVESSTKLHPADLVPFLQEEDGFFRLGVPPKGSCLLACSWGNLAFTVVGVDVVSSEYSMEASRLPGGPIGPHLPQ